MKMIKVYIIPVLLGHTKKKKKKKDISLRVTVKGVRLFETINIYLSETKDPPPVHLLIQGFDPVSFFCLTFFAFYLFY